MPRMKLHWPVDRSGYHVRRTGRGSTGTVASEGGTEYIARNGGELDSSVDQMRLHGLYHQLADCEPNATGALAFANLHGPLKAGGNAIEDFADSVRVVRSLIEAQDDVPRIRRWMKKNGQAIRFKAVVADDEGFFFEPLSLLDGIYAQFLEDAFSGAKLKLCLNPGCGVWFKYGPGTFPPKRETARYCSPRCQKAHAYSKTKGENP